MNKAARNEQLKITATWLNGAAIAALAVGCFAPITGYFTATAAISPQLLTILVGCWLVASFGLHIIARAFARRIED